MQVHSSSLRLLTALAAAPVVLFSSMTVAQPLTFSVSPTHGGSSIPSLRYAVNPAALPAGVTAMGYTQDGWMMVHADNLHQIGPRYVQPSGIRIGRGSQIPEWIDTGDMQSVSIRGLQSGTQYGYFISPDQKIVVMDPQSRRVMRVIR